MRPCSRTELQMQCWICILLKCQARPATAPAGGRVQTPERKATVLSAAANHNHATVLAGQSHHGKQKEPSNPMYTGQGEGTDLTKATSFLFFFGGWVSTQSCRPASRRHAMEPGRLQEDGLDLFFWQEEERWAVLAQLSLEDVQGKPVEATGYSLLDVEPEPFDCPHGSEQKARPASAEHVDVHRPPFPRRPHLNPWLLGSRARQRAGAQLFLHARW